MLLFLFLLLFLLYVHAHEDFESAQIEVHENSRYSRSFMEQLKLEQTDDNWQCERIFNFMGFPLESVTLNYSSLENSDYAVLEDAIYVVYEGTPFFSSIYCGIYFSPINTTQLVAHYSWNSSHVQKCREKYLSYFDQGTNGPYGESFSEPFLVEAVFYPGSNSVVEVKQCVSRSEYIVFIVGMFLLSLFGIYYFTECFTRMVYIENHNRMNYCILCCCSSRAFLRFLYGMFALYLIHIWIPFKSCSCCVRVRVSENHARWSFIKIETGKLETFNNPVFCMMKRRKTSEAPKTAADNYSYIII